MGTPDSARHLGRDADSVAPALRVLVVDDHRTIADLLKMALSAQDGLECVGTAGSADEAVALTRKLQPDAVIMDVRLGGDDSRGREERDGIAVIAELTALQPDLVAIVLTAYADRRLMERAAAAGACSILAKDGSLSELVTTLRTARPGTLAVSPQLLRTLVTPPTPRAESAPRRRLPDLTAREREVLTCLAEGMNTPEMSRALGVTSYTCRSYVKNVLGKLQAHSRHEAVSIAIREGLVDVAAGR